MAATRCPLMVGFFGAHHGVVRNHVCILCINITFYMYVCTHYENYDRVHMLLFQWIAMYVHM